MFLDVLATVRDVSVILLALETFVIALVVLLLMRQVTQGLRRFIPQVAEFFPKARETLSQIAQAIDRAMALVKAPFVWLASMATKIRAVALHTSALFKGR